MLGRLHPSALQAIGLWRPFEEGNKPGHCIEILGKGKRSKTHQHQAMQNGGAATWMASEHFYKKCGMMEALVAQKNILWAKPRHPKLSVRKYKRPRAGGSGSWSIIPRHQKMFCWIPGSNQSMFLSPFLPLSLSLSLSPPSSLSLKSISISFGEDFFFKVHKNSEILNDVLGRHYQLFLTYIFIFMYALE